MKPTFDEKDAAILHARQVAFDKTPGARVGDWVIMPDGSRERFTYDWGDSLQITDTKLRDGTFHFGVYGADYSGALDSPIPRASLVDTGTTAPAPVWFFHHDKQAAHNGVYVDATFRVFVYIPDAKR